MNPLIRVEVPQAGILGRIFARIYINDMPIFVGCVEVSIFADDVVPHLMEDAPENVRLSLQSD